MKIRNLVKASALALVAAAGFATSQQADACSRILYVGKDSLRIVGRSLDWRTPIPTNLYVYPRGIEKVGNTGDNVVRWKSKYGAIYAVSYDAGVTEGMNEKGLVVNALFCKGTVYSNAETENRPGMSLAMFVAWILDQNATTKEAVEVIRKHDFNISGATFDNGTVSALHWGITDASGDCAVIEFDNGNINIYEGQDLPAMTNDPTFPQMNAINAYWEGVGGTNMLPGTVKSPDRFVRGYFFDNHVEKTGDADLGFSIIRSILMNCSVPYLYTLDTAAEPNVSSTQWRSFSNLRDKRYYWDLVTHLGVVYIDLNKCDLREGAPVMKLEVSKHPEAIGEANNLLEVSKPFTPAY